MYTNQLVRSQSDQVIYLLNPDAIGCPVDWRWQRAQWRVSSRCRFRERTDDEWVRQAMKYQRGLLRGATNTNSDIAQAYKLFATDPWKRAELEARILANQPILEIAPEMRCQEGVFSAFENLFFDVRRRLFAQDWVICSYFGERYFEPFWPQDVSFAWRAFGFQYGPSIVDVLVSGADRDDLEKIGLPAYWSERSRLPKELQLLLLSLTIPDQGAKALKQLNRFKNSGLCKELPRFGRPPKDLSLDMAGEYSWSEIENETPVDISERPGAAKVA